MSRSANLNPPVPPRSQLILSVRDWSSLEEVALAASVATEHETKLYVERRDGRYRWRLIHRGGPYPLLRIMARFLKVHCHSIFIGFREISDGYCALRESSDEWSVGDTWAILTVECQTPEGELALLIREALG
jgi:hypothetical protein